MQSIRFGMMFLLTAITLAGCTNKPSNCFPGQRCEEYQVYTRCGSYLKLECEDICKTCNAYEPSCYSCYACIDSAPQSCLGAQSGNGRCVTSKH